MPFPFPSLLSMSYLFWQFFSLLPFLFSGDGLMDPTCGLGLIKPCPSFIRYDTFPVLIEWGLG